MAPDAAAALEGRLADLGRRITAARAEADARAAAPVAGRPFPKLLLAAVVLVVAIVAGGLALAARDTGSGAVGAAAVPFERVVTPDAASAAVPEVPAQAQGPAAAAAPVVAVPVAEPRTITVVTGESFWSIAEREVTAQLGRAPTDAEVTTWWADFVAANADRLVEPGNPNLVLPGQVLVAPGGG